VHRAWHAGLSSWAGETDINSCSIGIEIVNPGHEFGYPDFPRRQIAAVITLCRSILARRGPISPDRVLAHSDVAPVRKQDPGEKFPWALLNVSGVGHWVPPTPLTAEGDRFQSGDSGDAVAKIQLALSSYGYGVPATGTYDDTTRHVVTAFQRHFRPARVDGIADASTLQTLHALLKARPVPFSRTAELPARP
jgi:N-acetylmuramoyl-L-alanine amidase